MPHFVQNLTLANPDRHFVGIMRRMMSKGSNLGDITGLLVILEAEAVVMLVLVLAVNRNRKTSE